MDFLPNLRNRYSIRRFTVGTASILIGSLLFLGHNGEAKAAESTNDNTVVEASKDTSTSQQEPVENTVPQDKTTDTIQQAGNTQTTSNVLETVKTDALSKLSTFTHLTEETVKQYTAEVKQAQTEADVQAVVDKAQKAEAEAVKQAEAEQTKTVDSTKEQSAATTEVPKSTTESVKEETKADTTSATTSETNNTSEAKTVTSTDKATPTIETTPLSTEQKVDKVKTELASDYDSSKVDAALAVIDTTDLTEDQIKAEVLKLLLEQGSAQKDLYSPQATKLRSAVEEPTTAVRTFSVDTSLKDDVVVTPENFNQYFITHGIAYYDQTKGIATLTPDFPSFRGSITLDTKMNVNKDFHFTGAVNLGDKYEGHSRDGDPGGDGLAFVFNPGDPNVIGEYGSGLGMGGLPYAFGFKLDTYVNKSFDPKGKTKPDPIDFYNKGAFGAFIFADKAGTVTTQTGLPGWKAALLDVQPSNNQFQPFTIDYDGDTKEMTITYAGQNWKQSLQKYFSYTRKNEYSLSISASTGGAYNLQQVKLEKFTYTAAALLEEDFVDTDLQELIDRPLRTSGDVDKIITVQDPSTYLADKGYKLLSEDTSHAPTYDKTKKTIKLTNASQFLVYYVKDIEAPKIGDIAAPTVDVNTEMKPLVLDITDNSKHLNTKTVTGLPAGVTFDEATNTISGTPTAVGTSTITVTATDHAGLSTTKTFTYTVVDTKAPDVTMVVEQTTEAYTPMTPINVNAEDNSKVAPTLAVTGLPTGLSFDPTTKQITGTPTTVGTSTVTVSATDGSTNVGTSTFNIVVTPNKALEALKAAVADAKTVNKNDYTPNSVAALDAKLTEAEALIAHPENGSTDQFNAKTQEVKQAKDQLVSKADKTDLEKAIAEASKYTNLDPTKPMDQQLITALANAKNTDTDQNATQKAVDDSKNSLNNAIQEKLRADAYEKLQQAVMRGVQVAKTDGYTPNSLQAVKDTIQKVNPLVTASMSDDPTVRKQYTIEQIEQATKDINDSISGLVRQADKTELQKAIDKAGTLGILNPADTEDKAVQDKLATANTVKADGNATKAQVDQATADLNKAIDQKLYQDALDRLNAAIKDAKGVNQADYTPASVTPFDAAIKSGEAKAADKTATPEQLDAAAKAITDAKAQLQHNADKSALEAAINKAKALGALNEADAEDKAVKDALTAGEGVKDNANATTQQVADATKAINDAIAAKEHADALDALKAKLAEVKALDKAPFTPDSVNALNAQVTAGDAVVAAEKSKTIEEIKAATKALTDVQNALVKQADKTELEKAIAKAGTLGQLNAADTEDKAVQDALAKANQVKADGNATPQQVAEATDTLNKAIDKKLYQDALDELNAAIRDAEAVTKANYTPETVTPFEKAVTDGKAKAADSNATPEQLKAAAQAIKTAKDALKQKANKAELEKSIATAEALQPLKAGDPEDDAVKAALDKAKQVDANQNADQASVDAAKVELDNAIKAKQTQDAADALKQAALDELKAELAKVAKIDKNNFTPDSVTPLAEKETAGNAIVANPENKTVDEIKTATQALKDAEKGLQAKSDKAALQAAIDKAEALTGLNPADAEDKAVQDALAAAKKVNDNPNASQAEVQAATKTLNDAVAAKEHADALDALKAELAKVAGINKDQYTPNSVAPLNTKEADGKAIVAAPEAKTTEEIKAATQALKEAEAGLVDRADKTALQTAIEKAEALPNLDAADKEDKAVQAVQDALTAAKTVKEDANATPQAVQAATKALNDAVAAKERQDALDELNKAIKAAEAVNKDSFTPDSVAPFTTALNDGKAKAADTNATPAELKAAAKAITDAQNRLQPVADKAALQAAIAKAEALKDLNPADKEDKAVQDALAAAKTVNDNANATPDQVAQATKTLTDALAAKERQDALDELQKALDAANTVKKDDYKPSTVTPFEAAVQAGEAAKADTSKTPQELKEAAKAIKDAQNALQAKANKDELEKSIATAEGLGILNANDPEDKAVQDALNKAKAVQADQNADQAAVDAAKKALDDAINAKKAQDAKEAKEAADAKQAALDELKAELAKVAKIDKNNFTPDTVLPLTEKEDAGKAIVAAPDTKTTEDIKAATQALKDAQNNLVQKADKAELQKAIDKAKTLGQLAPADKEDKALQDAVTAGEAVKADGNATPQQVAEATKAINDAIAAKERQDALDELQKALDAANTVKKDDYKPSTVTPFEAAVQAGEAAKADTSKTPQELKEAAQAIKDAQNALQAKANKAELEKSIATAEGLGQLDANDPEDKAVQDALNKAKEVQADPNASQDAVDAAQKALDDAINAKKAQDAKEAKEAADAKQAALEALKAELEKAKAVQKDNFTPDSVKPLTDAETSGQAIVDAPDGKTTKEIEAATQALKDAQKDLVQKADKAELQKAIDKATGLGQLDPADKEDKAVQDALATANTVNDNQNATPQEVQQATEALNNAIAAKERQDALDELQKALDDAKTVKKDDYKPSTVTPFEAAVQAGEAAKADTSKTPQELKEAAKAIKDAQKALEAKANKAELEKSIATAEGLGQLDPTDTEDKVVQDALNKAKEVQADPNASQDAVDAAQKALDDAINAKKAQDAKEAKAAADAKQAALDALKEELAKVAKIDKDNFTPHTVAPLTEKEDAGKAIVAAPENKTTKEIEDATQALKDAEAALQAKSDKAALQAAIDKANALGQLDPTDKEDKALQDAVTAGEAVKADGNATPQQVQEATKAITDAIAAKERQDALDALQKALDDAKTVKKDDYKPNTVAPFEAAITAGEAAKADATKTPEELKAAAKAITDAKNNLEAKANKDELNKAITTAEGLTLDPNDKEDKAVQEALNKAKEVQANPNATQEEVNAAKDALNKAIEAKTAQDQADAVKAALDALKAELEKAKAVQTDKFTPDSVKPLTDAEVAGQAIVDAPTGKTVEEINKATQDLKDAQAGLVAKADKTELEKSIATAEGLGQLDPADKEDKAVQDALAAAKAVEQNPNATQTEVDNAKAALDEAINAKKAQDEKEAKAAADAKQAALDALKAELEKAKAINKDEYTPDSVKPLTDAQTAGQGIVDAPDNKTTAEIEAATQALKDAQKDLVQKADKAELQKAIDKANTLGNLDANDPEDKAVQDKLADAERVKADDNATPQQVAEATKALNDAIAAKEHQDALDELNKAIDAANAVNKADYKPNTVKPLEDAVKAGEAAKADATKTPQELKDAAKAITDAQKALEAKANKDELNKAITNADGLTLDPTDAEDKAVQDALNKAKEVQADPNASQADVDAAKEALENAVNAKNAQDAKEAQAAAKAKQDALDALKAELEKVAKINKDNFTPNTVAPLTEKEEAGKAIVANPDAKTTEEIKEATQALIDAENALQAKSDKAALQAAIDKANALGELNPADAEDKAVQDAVAAGEKVKADGNATPQEVADATKAINDAIAAKEHQDALDELQKAIEDAKAVNKDDFKPNTVKPFEDAVKAGETAKADATKTPQELKDAAKAITDAQKALEAKANKDELNKVITTAESLTLDPADKEDKAVQDALAKAKEVQADPNASQADVDAAKAALEDAINAKTAQDAKEAKEAADAKQAALDALKAELEKAKAINKDEYTPNSVKPLTDAETTGQAIVDAPDNKTTAEIEAATQALKDAQAGLVAKADKAELDKAITTADGLNLDPADKEDKAVQDALEKAKEVQANPNATQDEVNAAKDALNKAIEAKTAQDQADAKQAALDELKAELAKVAKIDLNQYTPDSVKPLTDKEIEGNAIVAIPDAKTTEEIKAVTQALKDAQAGLVQKADKAELQKAIDAANALGNLDAADKEDKAFQDAVAVGEKVKADGNATPQQVADATKAINDAIAAKEHQDALDELQKAIDAANAINKDDFKPNTVKPLEDAVAAGEAAKADATKTPEELKEAAKAITDAQKALEAKANKDELNKVINNAEGLTLDPTDKEDKAVQDALAKAKEVQADPNASQDAVDAAKAALEDAINAKNAQDAKEAKEAADAKQAALDALKAELEKAKAINKDDYTPNSVKPLTDAETTGQAIVDAPNGKTTEEIEAATQALKDAQAGLVAKADKVELDKAINNAEGLTLDPADKEDKAVQDALEKAKAVQANPNATQDEVNAAKDALNKAVEAKTAQDKADAVNAALDALKAELEKAKAINKDDYTPNSVKPLTDAEAAGQAIVDAPTGKTVEEIEKATQALKDAQVGLIQKADKSELQNAIDKANAIDNLEATDKEDKAILDAVAAGEKVKADGNATPQEVADATKAINDAIAAKEHQDALDELNKAIEDAKAVNKDDFKPNSVKPLEDAIKAGETAKADVTKTPEELKEAAKAINDAKNNLEAKANKDELNKAITEAEGLTLDPKDKEDKAVQDALDKAKAVLEDPNATQEAVDAAKDALNKAVEAKKAQDAKEAAEKQAALDALKAELEKAKSVDKDAYTPNSVKPLTDAVTVGQAIVDAPKDKTVEEIKKATQALKDAQAGLVAKADKAELDKAINNAEGLTLDPTDKEDKAVQDALDKAKAVLEDPNATQEAVDAAKDALNKAVEAKTAQDKADAVNTALEALKAELEKAKAINQNEFTPNSVEPLVDAMAVAQGIVNNPESVTVDQIKAATQALKDAQAGLVAKADKTELEKAINNAEGLTLDPKDKEDKAVQEALDKAKAVQADPNASQAEVDAAKSALEDAINAKIAQDKADAVNAALEALKAELEKAKAINQADFTPNSVEPLVDAMAVAQGIMNNPESVTVDQIKAATQALKDAQAGLGAKADKTELDKSINDAERLTLDPTDKEDKAVQDALDKAKAVQADANATQTEVDAAKDELNKAIEAKTTQDKADAVNAALEALKAELEKAKAINKDDYTPNSVKPLVDAMAVAQGIVNNPESVTVDQIKEATQALKDAQAGLVAKADKTELDKAINNAEGLTLDPADKEDKAVQDALDKAKAVQADANATQTEVDAAKDALNKAVEAKATQDKADALAELQKALDKAQSTDKTKYTPESVEKLDASVNTGKAVVENSKEVSIKDIKETTKAIEDALKALEVIKSPKTEKETDKVKSTSGKSVERTSDKAVKKSEGSKAQTKANKAKVLPNTGQETPADPKYATLMLAIGGLMALFGRRKKEDKDNTEK
ncbi:YSIRK-type signal peptide-containing protein [Staphylococcus simulans]|nr:YSIRK-type signal peptide-containing protein [Staphylococcus simulans]